MCANCQIVFEMLKINRVIDSAVSADSLISKVDLHVSQRKLGRKSVTKSLYEVGNPGNGVSENIVYAAEIKTSE